MELKLLPCKPIFIDLVWIIYSLNDLFQANDVVEYPDISDKIKK